MSTKSYTDMLKNRAVRIILQVTSEESYKIPFSKQKVHTNNK